MKAKEKPKVLLDGRPVGEVELEESSFPRCKLCGNEMEPITVVAAHVQMEGGEDEYDLSVAASAGGIRWECSNCGPEG